MAKTPRLVLVLLISGCASVESLVPQNGPTMAEIYNSHLSDSGQPNAGEGPLRQARLAAARRDAVDVEPDLRGYSRDVETEIDNLFPKLLNPTLVMHVFPHLAGEERLPVPGYSTSFSLYPRTEFALPGEVAVPARSARAAHHSDHLWHQRTAIITEHPQPISPHHVARPQDALRARRRR